MSEKISLDSSALLYMLIKHRNIPFCSAEEPEGHEFHITKAFYRSLLE